MEGPGLTATAAGAQPHHGQAEPAAHAPVPLLVTNTSLEGYSLEVPIPSLCGQGGSFGYRTERSQPQPGHGVGHLEPGLRGSPFGNKVGWKGVTLHHLCPWGATSGSAMRGTSECKLRDEEASLERKPTVLDKYK